jgi:uncharacterized protein YecA (UPF0149 family)
MFPLGSEKRPVIVRVQTQEKAKKIMQICEQYGFKQITGIEPGKKEDYSDLIKAIKERNTPANIYDPCPCGSGLKYKFCCAKKPIDLAL